MFNLPEDFAFRQTNHSIKSVAKIQYSIRSKPHWLSQLTTAELMIESAMGALEDNWLQMREYGRTQSLRLEEINQIRCIPKTQQTLEQRNKIAALEDELLILKRQMPRTEGLIRDAKAELEAATMERDRILAKHPEATALSYEELNARYSHVAFEADLAKTLSVKVIAAQTGLPEEVLETIANLDEPSAVRVIEQMKLHQDNLATRLGANNFSLPPQETVTHHEQ